MNHITKVLFFIFSLALCLSCSSGDATQATAAAADDLAVNATPAKKTEAKSMANTKSKESSSKPTLESYWSTLKSELGIDADKLEAIRTLNNKINIQVKDLRSKKQDNLLEKSKEIRLAEREEVKKILGDVLYQKKLAFDKNWTATNTKDFRKMSTNR